MRHGRAGRDCSSDDEYDLPLAAAPSAQMTHSNYRALQLLLCGAISIVLVVGGGTAIDGASRRAKGYFGDAGATPSRDIAAAR